MKKSFFIFFILMSSLTFSQVENVNSPKIAFKVPLGEMIKLENNTLKFVEVLEDSRCPKNTTCIWQGRAKVLVVISERGKESYEKIIIFGKINEGESDDKVLFSYGDTKVIGMTLNPYPNSEEAIDGNPYELLVYMEN